MKPLSYALIVFERHLKVAMQSAVAHQILVLDYTGRFTTFEKALKNS